MSFKYNDERRQEMERQGFLVRQIHVCRESHQVTSVWYVYDPRTEAQREAAEEAEFEAYMQKKASEANR